MTRRHDLEHLGLLDDALGSPLLSDAISEWLRPPLAARLTEAEIEQLEVFDRSQLDSLLVVRGLIEQLSAG